MSRIFSLRLANPTAKFIDTVFFLVPPFWLTIASVSSLALAITYLPFLAKSSGDLTYKIGVNPPVHQKDLASVAPGVVITITCPG